MIFMLLDMKHYEVKKGKRQERAKMFFLRKKVYKSKRVIYLFI